MRCSRGRGFFERHPARLALAATHARAIRETAETDMQLLGAETRWTNLGEVLQLEEHFAVASLAVAVNHGLAFFVVLRQRPGRDRLDITRAKSGAAVGVENIA